MIRYLPVAVIAIALSAAPLSAQQGAWRPPTRQMPSMPAASDLEGDWLGPRASWFAGLEAEGGVAPADLQAVGEPRDAPAVRLVRFQAGPVPVVVWSDRDGDGDADLIEIYRRGGVIIQLIDADYDGNANVIRRYDASGALISEERL